MSAVTTVELSRHEAIQEIGKRLSALTDTQLEELLYVVTREPGDEYRFNNFKIGG